MSTWTIPDLLQMSGGYWAPAALQAGVKLDFFSALAEGELSAAGVAARCGTEPRATGMLLDALAALGLLFKGAGGYSLTPIAVTALVRSSPDYIGHIIMHHHHLMAGWAMLPTAVRTGAPVRSNASRVEEEEARESFIMGMFNLASQQAPAVAAAVDLAGRRRLLDLGGGPGTYAIHFCLRNPQLRATIYDLPTSRVFAEATVNRFGLADRVEFAAGDYHRDQVPGGFDAVWLSHVLHAEGEEGCRSLLAKGAAALEPGGVLLVQEFILNDAKDGPVFPALFSLNMLLGTAAGRSYSEGEIAGMMAAAGLAGVRRLPADRPNGAGVIAGYKQ